LQRSSGEAHILVPPKLPVRPKCTRTTRQFQIGHSPHPMSSLSRPWSECPLAALRAVRGVLTDIDDTLTTEGAISPDALAALQALRDAGLPVMAITGRPMGWSQPFARDWPLNAIVAENGAVALYQQDGALRVDYLQDETTRQTHALRLTQTAERILREVPGSQLARDSAGRVTDIAIDHSEFAQLSEAQIQQVVAIARAEGLTATVSSIHINAWLGEHHKLSGARWIVQQRLGRDVDAELDAWVYVGDSTNDQLLFGHFPLSVGVANLQRFAQQLEVWPRYITSGERGAGFSEVVQAILKARV
jgi:HAD superfamily hydrolase (TIGR01484 family)